MARLLVTALAFALTLAGAPVRRAGVMQDALAHWRLGEETASARSPLSARGAVERGLPVPGADGHPDGKAARLSNAYFDAGNALPLRSDAVTVYLRARDPRGAWQYGLLNKRGSHERVTFNLFSVDLGGTPGPDIGFELHTDTGFVMVSFPVSAIAPTAWHDFVGRYDGASIALYCDGNLMAKRAWRGVLTRNDEPVLIGAETDHGSVVRPFTGEMEEAALWTRALDEKELALLMETDRIVPDARYAEPYASPIHYRPAFGRLADTIPFFWKGEYHVFYLRAVAKVPWEHIVSKDLVHWRELPTALVSDGAADGPDGLHMFTGSVIEKDGTFHIFYTGWNPANPKGREFIMHATSPDLIHWTKHPEDIVAPDGRYYSSQHDRDFRDPYLFRDAEDGRFAMFFCSGTHTGLATSADLLHWTLEPPIESDYTGIGTPECPDAFQIGTKHYLITSPTGTSSTISRYADTLRGPYHDPVSRAIDTPILYAAKRMYDGKRHILTGWLRDLGGDTDSGGFEWGGTQCVPREVTAGPDGQLLFRPVPEAVALFKRTVWDLKKRPLPVEGQGWRYEDAALAGGADGSGQFETPANYLLRCRVQLPPRGSFALGFREQAAADTGYRLTMRPETQEAEISSPAFRFPRRILLDATRPVLIEAFVQGDIIECFINHAFAFSCRAYNYRTGRQRPSPRAERQDRCRRLSLAEPLRIRDLGFAGRSGSCALRADARSQDADADVERHGEEEGDDPAFIVGTPRQVHDQAHRQRPTGRPPDRHECFGAPAPVLPQPSGRRFPDRNLAVSLANELRLQPDLGADPLHLRNGVGTLVLALQLQGPRHHAAQRRFIVAGLAGGLLLR
jgi:beta-fructofuranosidase